MRRKIAKGLNATFGIVMLVTELDSEVASQSVPVWKEYCRKHSYDFVIQTEPLIESGSMRHEWSMLRVLLDVLSQARWKYAWLVQPNSVVVNLEKPWPILIKDYMRHKRHHLDTHKQRMIWCPEECDDVYQNAYADGACHGPIINGCIFQNKKKNLGYVKTAYQKRHSLATDSRAMKKSIHALQAVNYDYFHSSDAKEEMGR